VAPNTTDAPDVLTKRIRQLEKNGLDRKLALKKAAKEYGLSKSDVYRLTKIKDEDRPRSRPRK